MRRRKLLPTTVGKVVLVQTKDGRTVRGVVAGVAVDALLLETADALDGGTSIPLDGRVIVPVENVAFIQEPSLAGALRGIPRTIEPAVA
jgi:small nuclear ribonucleoprotein (snRNP)-like protein